MQAGTSSRKVCLLELSRLEICLRLAEKNLEHYTNLAEAVSQMTVVLAEYEEKIKLWNDELLVRIDKIRTSTEQALQDSEDNRSNLELIKSNIRSLQGVMSYMAETYSQAAEEV